jgi:hypothetical protein
MKYQLGPYAAYAVQRILNTPDAVTEGNYVRVFQALLGCDQAYVAKVAARLMVKIGFDLVGDELPALTLKVFAKVSVRPGKGGANQGAPTAQELGLTSPHGRTFVQRYVTYFVREYFSRNFPTPAHAVRTLAGLEWWSSDRIGIHETLAEDMDRALNLAYGYTTHHRRPDDAYVAVVDELIRGRLHRNGETRKRLKIALYVIKHSAPTGESWDVVVDELLHAHLRTLWATRAFPHDMRPKLRKIMIANDLV